MGESVPIAGLFEEFFDAIFANVEAAGEEAKDLFKAVLEGDPGANETFETKYPLLAGMQKLLCILPLEINLHPSFRKITHEVCEEPAQDMEEEAYALLFALQFFWAGLCGASVGELSNFHRIAGEAALQEAEQWGRVERRAANLLIMREPGSKLFFERLFKDLEQKEGDEDKE
jgi:hypothetical protein